MKINSKFGNANDFRVLTVKDLLTVGVGENGSKLIDIREALTQITCDYKKMDMMPYIGSKMLVRSEIISLLERAYEILVEIKPGYTFLVQYGYRHPTIQADYFSKRYQSLQAEYPDLTDEDLIELTHTQVAYPPVSGHPTGGAIDVTIIDEYSTPLDMGSIIADYTLSEKCYTYCGSLSTEQQTNRILLSKILTQAGFAPFYGEWWHFSYGDREWAAFYQQPCSLYAQLEYQL